MKDSIFTEDNYHRTLTNLAVTIRSCIDYPCGKAERNNQDYFPMSVKDANQISRNVREFEEVSSLCERHFFDQFHHTSKVRRICENPDCHGIYAYFYEDFLYCPKCGTKLTTTRDTRENKENE